MILALDLGTRTGWAVADDTRVTVSGSSSFKPGRYEGGGMRYVRFRKWLSTIENDAGPFESVVFEEVRRHAATDAAHVYGGLLAHLSAWCEGRNIPYRGVPVGTIKKSLTGKGNASKAEMIAGVEAKGFAPSDDNEADAIALALFALEEA